MTGPPATAEVCLCGLLASADGSPELALCSSAWIQVASVAKSNGSQITVIAGGARRPLEFSELLAEIVWRIGLLLATIAERT